MRTIFTLFVFVSVFVACTSVGERESFVGTSEDKGGSSDDFTAATSSDVSTRAIDLLIRLERSESDDERMDLVSQLIALGRPALSIIKQKAARTTDARLSLDLLYVESRIESPEPPAPTDQPATGSDPSRSPTTASDSVETGYGIDVLYNDSDAEYDQAAVDKFVRIRFGQAYAFMRDGDRASTIRICDAILTLVPETRYRRQVQQLLSDARADEQHTKLVMGKLRLMGDVVQLGTDGNLLAPMDLRLTIKNVSRQTLELDFGSGQRALLSLRLRIDEEDTTRSRNSYEVRTSVELEGDLVSLAPGKSVEVRRVIEAIDGLPQSVGSAAWLATLDVSGSLRPASLRDKESGDYFSQPILLSGASAALLGPEFPLEDARADPILFLQREIEQGRPEHLAGVGCLLKETDYRLALDLLLADDIESSGLGLRRARLALAARLAGQDKGSDSSAWRKWWKENRTRY